MAGTLFVLASACPVHAQEHPLPPAVVAVIDYQLVLRESTPALQIREQIEQRRRAYEAEIAAQRERLAEEDRKLKAQRGVLTPQAYRIQREKFEIDVATVQRLFQERRGELDRASSVALQKVRDAVVEAINALRGEFAFNVVLSRADVLVFTPDIDLTGPVLEAVNARLPDIRVEFTEG